MTNKFKLKHNKILKPISLVLGCLGFLCLAILGCPSVPEIDN